MSPVVSFDIWSIIFLIAAAQGIFLSVALFISRSGSKLLLALLTFLFSACLLFYIAYWANMLDHFPRQFRVVLGFTYFFGPLVYFYIRSGKTGTYFNWKHFIPFGAYLIYTTFQSIHFSPLAAGIQLWIQNIHLVVYIYIIYGFIKSDRPDHFKLWRQQLLIAYSGYVLSFLSYYILVYTGFLRIEYDYMISLASSGFIYFIGYKGLVKPGVLKNYDNHRYQRSSLSREAGEEVMSKIKTYFHTHRPYLKSDFKLSDLARETRFSPHHISQSINEVEGISFSGFVNQYRYRAAREKLSDQSNSKLRVIDIAYDCGFNNKTTFATVFKQYEGITPSEYRKRRLMISAS